MLSELVERKKHIWLTSPHCPMRDIFSYIRKTGKLRSPQIEAIENYLFLKTEGENRPLAELLIEGFFVMDEDYEDIKEREPYALYEFMETNPAAISLYKFAQINNRTQLVEEIRNNRKGIDYEQVIKDLFYKLTYPDYLMSLPMGAGKTFLMAAIIYLDLHLRSTNPASGFAANFLILIPNALKSSIGPSLKNIIKFDPTWVLPPDVATKIKSNIKFEVLDKPKKSRKTLQTSNPNALKVMHATRSGFNHIFLVNAEKIILDDYKENESYDLPSTDEGQVRRNELRYSLSQLPELGIFVDEVHHVHTSDHKEIKLRKVINQWNQVKDHNIFYMLGFSGTPHLPQVNTVKVSDNLSYKMKNITNTVYHYPLYDAVEGFLKRPIIKIGNNKDRAEIITEGVIDFITKFGDKKYNDGRIAKLVIYCPSIEVLEEEVYPLLTGPALKVSAAEILRYHKGNKKYKLSSQNEEDFLSLDNPDSPYRFILLVQVGREGWDCHSLTGVILSQEGDCSKNMVLQTCCRCLREVDQGDEEALIWLNKKNATHLDSQLKKEQDTSIEQLNSASRKRNDLVDLTARLDYLELDKVEYYQLRIQYQDIVVEENAGTARKLNKLSKEIKEGAFARDTKTGITGVGDDGLGQIREERTVYRKQERAVFTHWLLQLSKGSFGLIKIAELLEHEKQLRRIFNLITFKEKGESYWGDSYNAAAVSEINRRVRLCFHKSRRIDYKKYEDKLEVDLFNRTKLKPIVDSDSANYPDKDETAKILEYDSMASRGDNIAEIFDNQHKEAMRKWAKDKEAGKEVEVPKQEKYDESLPIISKNRAFHYIPHSFDASQYEKEFFQKMLASGSLKDMGVEIYYNGKRHIDGFTIECYVRHNNSWRRIGNYTTDFLLIKRDDKNNLHKIMLIETKGEVFSHSPEFQERKKFVDKQFIKQNNELFGYKKFDFMHFLDSERIEASITKLERRASGFFAAN